MHIYAIRLENIKAFDEIRLDFARPDQVGEKAYAGLNFFVGGNSSGKSSLLKSLAIGIAGPTVANQLLVAPAGWVRREATRGLIELKLHWHAGKDYFRTKSGTPSFETFDARILFE